MSEKEILFMNPVFTHNIWGGTKLRDVFGYKIEGNDIGECWGIAAHPNGTCMIANGTYQGEKLSDLWEKHRELFGESKVNELQKLIECKYYKVFHEKVRLHLIRSSHS